jgi:MscS family membrane protein
MFTRACLLTAFALLTGEIDAQPSIAPNARQDATNAPAPNEDVYGRETPYGCVSGFLKAVARGDYSEAAQFLDTRKSPSQAQELARQLQVVINNDFSGDVNELSRARSGTLTDGLPENRERVGTIQTTSGNFDLLLSRVQRPSGPSFWLFSTETLAKVPDAFEDAHSNAVERFVERSLSPAFRGYQVLSLPLWRWVVIMLGLIVAVALASLVTRALIPLLRVPVRRWFAESGDQYLVRIRPPLRLLFLSIAIGLLGKMAISVLARAFWAKVAWVVAVISLAWLLIQFANIVNDLRSTQLRARSASIQNALFGLAHRIFRLLVVFFAVALLLHGAGVNVSAMLAGLGIGGIALALAAQKTVEDLFGGVALVTRRAVRVGDFCKVADNLGIVEDIGLGAIRVRTLNRTVLTIPNGKVSQMELENFSMREKMWFHPRFGLPFSASPERVRSVLAQVTDLLKNDPRVEREGARIRLVDFGPSSLTFEVFAYVTTPDYTAFLQIQEDLLLRIMDVINAHGMTIAMPSQAAYIIPDKPGVASGLHPMLNERAITECNDGNKLNPEAGVRVQEAGVGKSHD